MGIRAYEVVQIVKQYCFWPWETKKLENFLSAVNFFDTLNQDCCGFSEIPVSEFFNPINYDLPEEANISIEDISKLLDLPEDHALIQLVREKAAQDTEEYLQFMVG